MHPLRVGWPAPDLSASDARAYAAWFGVPVEDLPVPIVVFAAEDTQRPFLTANHGMWKFFEPALRQRLADLEKHASTVERLRSVLLEALPAGELSMPGVCRKLGVSKRILQRRLQAEGSSFQQTLDALRNSLAHHYLHVRNTVRRQRQIPRWRPRSGHRASHRRALSIIVARFSRCHGSVLFRNLGCAAGGG
ncbi:hypothetical protein [Mesorhizobium sp. M1272]|uniref:hypothetical protein n=1 Tax=Mesorhizobium sp. M1272 TaxID=2957074 RepID=UPI00333A5E96